MKQMHIRWLKVVCILLLMSAVVPAFAMDYVLGARAGFFFWRPFYKDLPEGSGFEDVRTGHGGLYGPILVANLTDRWGISVSGLFGQQTTQWHSWNGSGVEDSGNLYNYSRTSYMEANRFDVDTTVSFALFQGFRAFAGYKFQYMKVGWFSTERIYNISSNSTDIRDQEFEFRIPLHGIALGCGYTANLSDLYFFAVSISGIYTRGIFSVDQTSVKYINTGLAPPQPNDPNPRYESMDVDMHQFGVNIEPSVGIRTPGPLVTLGVRYQILRTQFYNLDSSGGDGPDDRWMNDHLYGIFVTVMYVL